MVCLFPDMTEYEGGASWILGNLKKISFQLLTFPCIEIIKICHTLCDIFPKLTHLHT